MSEILTRRHLSRATLARQLLLERQNLDVVTAVESLAGMQAQEPQPPFIGLWTRLRAFEADSLHELLHARQVVRATAMRGTIHLLSARDFLAWRPALHPCLAAGMRSVLGARVESIALDAVLESARRLLSERPRTFAALRKDLAALYPDDDPRALGYAVRMLLPLVQIPSEDRWSFPRQPTFGLADGYLATPVDGPVDARAIVRGYLAAYGPASVIDAQSWSGLRELTPIFEALGEELVTYEDEKGRVLYDLVDAPRPAPGTPAPARFLPAFDNLVLAYAERTRVVPDAYRSALVTRNLRVHPTFLVDGLVAGTWKVTVTASRALLEVHPFAALDPAARRELGAEADRLVEFCAPTSKRREVKFAAPAAPSSG